MTTPQVAARRTVLGNDVALPALLFTVALCLAELFVKGTDGGDVAARLLVLTMIVPVVLARRAPLAAAVIQASASLMNGLAYPHVVRCGVCLPAAFYVAYVVGSRSSGWWRASSIAAVLLGVELQCEFDPQLGPGVIAMMAPVTLAFFGAGVFLRSRSALVARLRESNTELREQRERTAVLAVETDRARIFTAVDDGLRTDIQQIVRTAAEARNSPQTTQESLQTIEVSGRAALDRMRDIVGTIRSAPTAPEPGLDELTHLVRTATTADVRFSVTGPSRPLPASIELSGYRIVEHLLSALEDDPAARVRVRVRFEPDTLELNVAGPPAAGDAVARTVAAVRDRAALHGGTLETTAPAGLWQARVRLPLVTSHA